MKKILITTLLALIFTGCETENDVVESGGVILATFAGNLEINSKSSLDSAITDGSYVNSIGGNLSINTGASTGITAADVKKISSQIQSVDGNRKNQYRKSKIPFSHFKFAHLAKH